MRIAAGLVAFALLAGCGKLPRTYVESIEQATLAWNRNDMKKAFALCVHAFDLAIADRNVGKALEALECEAEAAWRLEQPLKAESHLRFVLNRFEPNLQTSAGAHRLRNNFAVALVAAGKRDEGREMLEATLDAYEGTASHSSNDYRVRMQLLTSLARLALDDPDGPLGVRLSTAILQEIQVRLDGDARYGNTTPPGEAPVLTHIAEITLKRGDPERAKALAELAKERREEEKERGIDPAAPRICHKLTVRLMAFSSCFREVPPPPVPLTL